jgi:hypothetical protein
MAFAGIKISADFPELNAVRQGIRDLGQPRFTATALGDALKQAIQPAYLRLQQLTPVGPTGNLKRAAAFLVKRYPKDGNAVAMIGYRRSGLRKAESAQGGSVKAERDRGYHQWWLEFGTQERLINRKSVEPYGRRGHMRRVPGKPAVEVKAHRVEKGQNQYIASSFKKLGPFKMVPTSDGSVRTDPAYPNAFFKASRDPIIIPPVRPGGLGGLPPVRSAFEDTQGQVASILTRELNLTLSRALDTLTYSDTKTISGL